MKTKSILLTLLCGAAALAAGEQQLSNEYWNVKIDPQNGCKGTSVIYKPFGKELVNTWTQKKRRRGPAFYFGGAWGGHMGGSYGDEQGTTPYKVIRSGKDQITAVWDNPSPIFAGLREERTIALQGAQIKVKVKITNRSKKQQTFIYRMQDFFGSRKDWKNLLGFVRGAIPEVFSFYDSDQPQRVFMNLRENGIAMFNFSDGFGMLITSRKPVNGIYTWFSPRSENNSTVEFFMDQVYLKPGEVWENEYTYCGFTPSKPETMPEKWRKWINPAYADSIIRQQIKERSPLPYHAVCDLNLKADQLQIYPVSAADQAAGKGYPSIHRLSVKSMKLFGTPGERVDFVLALKAGNKKIQSAWGLKPFKAADAGWCLFGGKKDLNAVWDLRYLTDEGYFLVHDQKLTGKNLEIATFGNSLKDTEKWTDLQLNPGQVAWVKVSCRIPENAAAGLYQSSLTVGGEKIDLALDVLPYRLNRENVKIFGSFFRAYISHKQFTMTKEEFLDSLRFASENWNNSIVFYTSKRDELLWSIDQLYKMGWRNAVICPIARVLSAKQIKELEKKYGYTFLTWGVDEPASYRALANADLRLAQIKKGRYRLPTFTPSTFMGALYADIRPDYVPIFNTNGLMTILMDRTRKYAAQNRSVYWYSCPTGMLSAREQLKERLLHGLYLWKAPAAGIFDWGEDVHSTGSKFYHGGYCGFMGKKFVSTIRRDNSYEGYKDYLYLKTLQDAVAANPKAPSAEKAHGFLKDLSALLDDNYYNAVTRVDDVYLNSIREKAAYLTAAILAGK